MNRISNFLPFVLIAVILMLTAYCTSGGKSPSDVLISAYMTGNDGKYSEAEAYLSSDLISAIKGDAGTLAGGMKGLWDKETRNGTIEKIEIVKEEFSGEGAKVYFKIHFKDGKTNDDYVPFIKEKGQWKMTIGD